MAAAYLRKLRLFRRNVRLYLVAATLIGFTRFGIQTVLLNLYLLRLGFGPEFVGLFSGLGGLAFGVFCLPAGAMGKRWGSRRLLLIGVATMAVGYTMMPLSEVAPTDWRRGWLLASSVLSSVGVAAYAVNGVPFLMSATGSEERNHAFSAMAALQPLSGFAGSLVGGALPGAFGQVLGVSAEHPAPYRYPLSIAALLLVPAILALVSTRADRVETPQERATESGHAPFLLMLVMVAFVFLRYAGEAPVSIFFNVYFDTTLGTPTALIGGLAGVIQLVSAPAALLTPLLVARWGNRRIIVAGSVGIVLSILPLALIPHWVAAGVGTMGVSALFWMTGAPIQVHSQEIVSPGWRATMSGALTMGTALGAAAMAMGGGHVIPTLGYRSLYLIGAGLIAAGALVFWAYFRVPRGELATVQPRVQHGTADEG